MHGAKPDTVIVATGSGAILEAGVRAFVTRERPLVTADPSYGSPAGTANRMDAPVKAIAVDSALQLNLEAMVTAAVGAGLVFLCNPNNPTSTVHTLADVEQAVRRLKERSPETAILIREWTLGQFKQMGYDAPDSQTNFVFVNIGRPAAGFRDACRAQGVAVGRHFPPMEKTHARISLGTMDDMQRAMRVFRQVLGPGTARRDRRARPSATCSSTEPGPTPSVLSVALG